MGLEETDYFGLQFIDRKQNVVSDLTASISLQPVVVGDDCVCLYMCVLEFAMYTQKYTVAWEIRRAVT